MSARISQARDVWLGCVVGVDVSTVFHRDGHLGLPALYPLAKSNHIKEMSSIVATLRPYFQECCFRPLVHLFLGSRREMPSKSGSREGKRTVLGLLLSIDERLWAHSLIESSSIDVSLGCAEMGTPVAREGSMCALQGVWCSGITLFTLGHEPNGYHAYTVKRCTSAPTPCCGIICTIAHL